MWKNLVQVVTYTQFSSVTQSCLTLRPHELQHFRPLCPLPTPGVHSNSCPSSQWCHPAISSWVVPFSSCPNPSQHQGFSNESTLRMRWPKYWSFSFSIIPSKEMPGLISFRMGWLDLLAVQENLKSLLQHHSSKASILRCSAFFTVQLSHPYMTTGKTIALTSQTFVGKLMSLLFNMLSRLVITFLPRSQFLPGGQSIGASASASILPMNIQDWFSLGLTGWISSQSKGLSSLLQHYSSKASILWHSAFFTVQISHPYMTTGKNIALTRQTFVGKLMSLLFNMLSRLVITFLPRNKCLLISWLQSPSAVILEPPHHKKTKDFSTSN